MTARSDGMGPDRHGPGSGGAGGLDDLLAAASAAPPPVSEALMARVLADALAEQPRAVAEAPGPRARGPGPLSRLAGARRAWARLVWAVGGTGAVAGMGTAAMAGLVIGLAQPGGLSGLDEAMLGVPLETVELVPGVDVLLREGN